MLRNGVKVIRAIVAWTRGHIGAHIEVLEGEVDECVNLERAF